MTHQSAKGHLIRCEMCGVNYGAVGRLCSECQSAVNHIALTHPDYNDAL